MPSLWEDSLEARRCRCALTPSSSTAMTYQFKPPRKASQPRARGSAPPSWLAAAPHSVGSSGPWLAEGKAQPSGRQQAQAQAPEAQPSPEIKISSCRPNPTSASRSLNRSSWNGCSGQSQSCDPSSPCSGGIATDISISTGPARTMLGFSRFEILTFDCYGTLINWEAGILSALHRVLSAHGKKIDDAVLLKLYGDFEQLSEQGEFHPYRKVLESVVRRFGAQLGFSPTAAEAVSLSDSLPTWEPWPDSVAALRQLGTRYRLAIVSNVDDDLFATTRPKLGVDFAEVITAEQAQAYKPS